MVFETLLSLVRSTSSPAPVPANGILLLLLAPLNHAYIMVPLIIAGLFLVFLGSRLSQALLVLISASVAFLSFMLTLPTLLGTLPDHFAIFVAFVASVVAAIVAARSAFHSESTVPILAFVAGGLTPNLLVDFSGALKANPTAGPAAAAIACGLVASRLSTLAPAHFAAASTSVIGARLGAACILLLSNAAWAPAEALGCFGLAAIGYLCQVCFFVPKDEDSEGRLPYARI